MSEDFRLSRSIGQKLLRLAAGILAPISVLILVIGADLFFDQGRENGWDFGEDTQAVFLTIVAAAVPALLAWVLFRASKRIGGTPAASRAERAGP